MNCTKVLTVAARRDLIQRKNLCYNCLGDNHLVSACHSRPCNNCGQRHHTSLCQRRISTVPEKGSVPTSTEKNLSASTWSTSTLHTTVRAMVNGQEARIMIDTGVFMLKKKMSHAVTHARLNIFLVACLIRQFEYCNHNHK